MALGETRTQQALRPRHYRSYFLRRPRIASTAPEINAIALPADAGLISGTAGVAKAALPTPINSKTVPNSFNLRSPLDF